MHARTRRGADCGFEYLIHGNLSARLAQPRQRQQRREARAQLFGPAGGHARAESSSSQAAPARAQAETRAACGPIVRDHADREAVGGVHLGRAQCRGGRGRGQLGHVGVRRGQVTLLRVPGPARTRNKATARLARPPAPWRARGLSPAGAPAPPLRSRERGRVVNSAHAAAASPRWVRSVTCVAPTRPRALSPRPPSACSANTSQRRAAVAEMHRSDNRAGVNVVSGPAARPAALTPWSAASSRHSPISSRLSEAMARCMRRLSCTTAADTLGKGRFAAPAPPDAVSGAAAAAAAAAADAASFGAAESSPRAPPTGSGTDSAALTACSCMCSSASSARSSLSLVATCSARRKFCARDHRDGKAAAAAERTWSSFANSSTSSTSACAVRFASPRVRAHPQRSAAPRIGGRKRTLEDAAYSTYSW